MGDAKDRNAGIWIEHSDRLYVAAYSSAASLVVRFSGYFRKMDGTIGEYALDVEPTSDRAATTKDFFFGPGFLLSCMATLSTGSANRGECYVRAHIQRGTGTAAVKLHNLLGGYVSNDFAPSFPHGTIQGPLEGPGFMRLKIVADVAAGLKPSTVVPDRARWRIVMVEVTLTTLAGVANRELAFNIYTPTVDIASASSGQVQTASLQRIYRASIGQNQVYSVVRESQLMGFGEHFCPAGSTIAVQISAMQVDDEAFSMTVAAEEWIEA